MWRDLALLASRNRRFDHVSKRLILRYASQSTGPPLAEIVLHAPLARLAEQAPRLPAGARHDRHHVELFFSILRSIAAAQRLNQSYDLGALLESFTDERLVDT